MDINDSGDSLVVRMVRPEDDILQYFVELVTDRCNEIPQASTFVPRVIEEVVDQMCTVLQGLSYRQMILILLCFGHSVSYSLLLQCTNFVSCYRSSVFTL